MRKRYKVTLSCDDGSKPEFTVWSETPEYAIIKARRKLAPNLIVVGEAAEEIKPPVNGRV